MTGGLCEIEDDATKPERRRGRGHAPADEVVSVPLCTLYALFFALDAHEQEAPGHRTKKTLWYDPPPHPIVLGQSFEID